MDPREFLELADEWSTGGREGEWRSAASRAYYAAFHAARIILGAMGFVVPRGDGAHQYLWRRLANCGHLDVQRAGNQLNDLRRVRNRADYDLGRPFPGRWAVARVLSATEVIDTLEAVRALPHLLTQITGAIRVYERTVLGQVTWHP
jgi:uncharacterized protein (UPF0332 family)